MFPVGIEEGSLEGHLYELCWWKYKSEISCRVTWQTIFRDSIYSSDSWSPMFTQLAIFAGS